MPITPTITTLNTATTYYAIAPRASAATVPGYSASATQWLVLGKPTWDTEPKLELHPMKIAADGAGQPIYSRRIGTTGRDNLYHVGQLLWPAPGAPQQLMQYLTGTMFPYGGACTIYGDDPYGADGTSSNGRIVPYCFWDCIIELPNSNNSVPLFGGYTVTFNVLAATRRTS